MIKNDSLFSTFRDYCTLYKVSGKIPTVRDFCSVNMVENKLYLFGGKVGGVAACNDFYVLEIDQLKWKKLQVNNYYPSNRFHVRNTQFFISLQTFY